MRPGARPATAELSHVQEDDVRCFVPGGCGEGEGPTSRRRGDAGSGTAGDVIPGEPGPGQHPNLDTQLEILTPTP